MKKLFLQTTGFISFALGVIGAFLPLLPSTVFILLAAWLLSKSSPRFHAWLVFNSPFSQAINDWQQYRIIPRRAKLIASVSIILSFSLSAYLVSNPLVITLLAAGLLLLMAYLLTRESEKRFEPNKQTMSL